MRNHKKARPASYAAGRAVKIIDKTYISDQARFPKQVQGSLQLLELLEIIVGA